LWTGTDVSEACASYRFTVTELCLGRPGRNFVTQKMEATCSSEMSVLIHNLTRCQNPEVCNFGSFSICIQ